MYGYNLERKDRTHGRAGGVACYVRNDVLYKRLDSLEVPELEVIWIKIMPKKLPRKVSCILVACVYYTQHTDYSQMRYHLIMGIDTMIRKHPECGVIVTGDFNQLNDHFLKVHYRFVQVVNVVTRGQATLDKIWTNMNGYYSTPVSISELGTSDHCMVLWKPDRGSPDIRGNVTRMTVKCMGPSEKAAFAMGVASIRWEPLFRLTTCEEKYSYYQTIVNSLMEHCFPIKTVTRHTADKPLITDMFRNLIRKRQRAYKSVNRDEYRVLRKANIIPLPKTKPLMSVKTDIRPISITSIAAKVFESIIMKYVDDIVCDAMDSKQFGGIAGTSTTDALVSMTHRWYEATDILNTYVRVVMLDFSKAFDLINHHILLEKLTNSGLPRHIVRWIGAFLLDRRQKVMIGSNCSRSGSPNGGVPQGTLSGPKCFLLYVNDLESNVPLYKYVDDSTLFEICNTTDVSVMQESIDRAVNWTNNNCMKINSKKSKEMVICFTPDEKVRNSIPSIVIDGNIVETVEYAKLLGVPLSNDLSWNRHVDCIVKKGCQTSVYVISVKESRH